VSGQSLVGTPAVLYLMAPITPLFVDEYLQEGGPVGDRRLSKKAKRFVPGASILLTNWNSSTYGHWLLEGMPKLLLLRRIAHQLPRLRIVLPDSLPTWIGKWIELVLPNAAIERYDDLVEYVQCEVLLLPTLLLSPEHFPHPELATLLEDIRQFSTLEAGPCTRIFVSRVARNPFREMVNQAEIEQIALEEGLMLIQPETLSIPEQIAHFAQAKLIVGEFGSAMHNTLFSPPGARVFCLNWINPLQCYISQLKRQHVGYLLPSSGVPVTYVLGKARVGYHIDPRVFRNCLRTLHAS
jgi:capsular polysaccharide biosynthesis protein